MNFENFIEVDSYPFDIEGKISDDMIEKISMLTGKGAEIAWAYFEKELGDSEIYPGDAVPEDYLEIMSDEQIKELYTKVKST